MPRQPRLDVPGIPLHLVHRGNDRQPCFLDDHDRVRYLDDLRVISRERDCAIHAYVLMTNHVHLLLTPAESGRVPRLMQSLGRRYVRYFNDRHGRTGTLWEGRYRAGPVEIETYLLRCYRYIELNPVRAAMASSADGHRWSSYAANALGVDDSLVTPHAAYLALGSDAAERQRTYRAVVAEAIPEAETDLIRRELRQQRVLGSDRFKESLGDRSTQTAATLA